jgi:segregation and condensation protein B
LDTSELKAIVESLLFVADAPLRPERIAEALDLDRGPVVQVLQQLEAEYRQQRRGFVLEEVAGGFQFRTRAEYVDWVRRLNKSRPFRFSRAALETLAIVAYRQPITRAEIEYLRGVDSGGVVKTLLDRHLLRILGKKDIAGRPMIYGTTREFLELFGLRDLSALPTLKEFSELTPEALREEGLLNSEVPEVESNESTVSVNEVRDWSNPAINGRAG